MTEELEPPSSARRRGGWQRWWARAAVGAAIPIAVALLLEASGDPPQLRPAALLLVGVVVAVAITGMAGGAAASVVATALVWWEFTTPRFTLRLNTAGDAWAIVAFALGCVIVLLGAGHLERGRRREAVERRLSDTIISEAPIGIAVFDRSSRLKRVNRTLAAVTRRPMSDYLGRRPVDLDARTSQLFEPFVNAVIRSGAPIIDRTLEVEDPETSREWHWRASYYPVRDAEARIAAVGALVDDVTDEIVAQRRALILSRLAQMLAAAVSEDDVAEAYCMSAAEAFRARTVFAVVSPDGSSLAVHPSMQGYAPEIWTQWADRTIGIEDPTPFAVTARTGALISVKDLDDFVEQFPNSVVGNLKATGDQAGAWTPVPDPSRPGSTLAVLRLAWPAPRELTPASITLLQTIASLVGLALQRVHLGETAAQDRFRSALDSMLDGVTIGRAIRDAEGTIVDFVIEYMNPVGVDGAGRGQDEIVGQRLCDLFPGWRASGMFDRYVHVVESGKPVLERRFPYEDTTTDGVPMRGYWSLQVAKLGDGYLAMFRDVTAEVEAERLAAENEELATRQRVTMQLLQAAAIPQRLPALPGVELGVCYQPVAVDQPLGGDWYDVFLLSPTSCAVVIADVAGHGPEAAAFMVEVRNVIRALAIEHESPDRVLRAAADALLRLNPSVELFVTCCLAVVDVARARFAWSCAGHLPPLFVRRSGEAAYGAGPVGPPILAVPDATYVTSTVGLASGDRVLLFTDGLVERRAGDIDTDLAALRDRVDELRHLGPQDLVEELAAQVVEPADDLAIVCIDHL